MPTLREILETPPSEALRRWRDWFFSVRLTPYIPHSPTPKQALFLCNGLNYYAREVFYGGQPGGGKSDALLMAALQYVDVPGYRALLLRRTYADLALPEALMDRAASWLSGTDARWNNIDKTWHFPSGATLTFGYLKNRGDEQRYKSAEFQFIGFDEVTQFHERQYTFLFSRLRRLANSRVPLRMRSAGNPPMDAIGMWVRDRFVVNQSIERPFIPAGLDDNPYIDKEAYLQSLAHLDEHTRRALFDWFVASEGLVYPEFNEQNITTADARPDPDLPYEIAIDDGYYPDPRVTLFIQRQPSRILVFHELRQFRTLEEKTVRDIVRIARDYGLGLPEIAVVSHEAPALRERLRLADIPARSWLRRKPRGGNRSARVAAIKLLRPLIRDENDRRVLQVHPRCKGLIEEFTQLYRYPEDTKARADDRPEDGNDHAVEALQSWVYARIGARGLEDLHLVPPEEAAHA